MLEPVLIAVPAVTFVPADSMLTSDRPQAPEASFVLLRPCWAVASRAAAISNKAGGLSVGVVI